MTRHVTVTEAKKLCPNLICQHVATWREGDEKWAYHDDAFQNIATHKVSLDPYRLESRRILACIKETLPADTQRVEKASVDEVFMDLSKQIHSILLERFPELAGPAPYDDPTENLPLPPSTALDWKADALVDLDTDETEDDDPDWDDITMLIGSEIIRDVRAAILEKLKYTCSGGVAQNKMLAKLGSAHKKPNAQTVVRNRASQQFLSDFKFTKIRNLGGKTGEEVVKSFGTDLVKELLPVPIEQLKQKLGEETGSWVYNVIRGTDNTEVNSRTQIKSMLSAKSFRPSINTPEQACRWLRIFCADIFSRLVEEGVHENKRRPKTLNLYHRQGGQTKSRSVAIPQGRKIEEAGLFDLAKNLLGQIILEGRVWPCANLSLSVAGFEEGISGNMGIGAFLVKGDEAKALNDTMRGSSPGFRERSEKRRRIGDPGIQKFLLKAESTGEQDHDHDEEFGDPALSNEDEDRTESRSTSLQDSDEQRATIISLPVPSLQQTPTADFSCQRCNQNFESANTLQSHKDWHFAKDLQDEDRQRGSSPFKTTLTASSKKPPPSSSKQKASGRNKLEKGQSKLNFG